MRMYLLTKGANQYIIICNMAQIICFTKQVYQDYIIVYPPCDEKASYIVNGIVTDGKALSENGILIDDLKPFDCKSITAVRRT